MPYPNEHSARVKDPGAFEPDSFRRKTLSPGVAAIMGRLKGETTMTVQAYRFAKAKFTAEQAKAWLKEHDVKGGTFEAAKEEKAIEDIAALDIPELEEPIQGSVLRRGQTLHRLYNKR